jgi:membrane protein implicated in regulation of membrane protease activity
MWRSALAYAFLLVAAVLLVAEAMSALARFGMFAGGSEVVPVRVWWWADAWRVLGAVVLGVLGYRLLRRDRSPPNRAA